jgi:uncharacterized FlaG/YvyC family protein
MKGNKGEWSELYTFFKLLAEGKMFSADENLERTEPFVELKSIYRKDAGKNLNFKIIDDSHIKIIDANTNNILLSFPQSEAKKIAKKILKGLNEKKISISEELINSIQNYYITQVADKSLGKGDINIQIYDPIHGTSSNQEFSIKSFLGSDPTLFNANKTTNIKYKITDKKNNASITEEHRKEVNSIIKGHKYIKRIAKLKELGYNIEFHSYDDSTFKLNLQVIDSDLPELIAHIVKDKYVSRLTKFSEVITKLTKDNPMNYDLSQGHKFYEYRLVNFLVECALGMTSKSVWSGKYDIVGGIIIVKPDAEILCYHLIDFNNFKQYLKNSARLDNPGGGKMNYGDVIFEGDNSFIKLNFQIKA